jgi:hypothetical protein
VTGAQEANLLLCLLFTRCVEMQSLLQKSNQMHFTTLNPGNTNTLYRT